MARKNNYLNNKDLMLEIHRSKMKFCWIADEKYSMYDLIVDSIDEIDDDAIEKAKENVAARIQSARYKEAMEKHPDADYRTKPKQKDFAIDVNELKVPDLVFRVMTNEHVPMVQKKSKEVKAKVNFPAFKHYAFINGELEEVARSHWIGDLETGGFSVRHEQITPKLGHMYMKLVERYSHKFNWRGYSYIDEMRGFALVQLSHAGLQFNEAKSDNPFSYLTAVVTNTFRGVLNTEKGIQNTKDEILIEMGQLPSFSKQLDHEAEMKQLREELEANAEFGGGE